MILNNYKRLMIPYTSGANSLIKAFDGTVIHLKETHKPNALGLKQSSSIVPPSDGYATETSIIALGTGDAPVDPDDYMLDEMITSGVNVTVAGASLDRVNPATTLTTTFSNNGVETLTVQEIGVFYTSNTETNRTSKYFLIYREVLENPIVAEVGATFTVSVRFDYGGMK